MIGFDELQHDYKNPVDQCNNLNPLVLPEYAAHALILILMMSSGEATSAILNIPLLRDPHYRIKEIKFQGSMFLPFWDDIGNAALRDGK